MLKFEDTFVMFVNERRRICVTAKFCERVKMTKFGTKNTLFEYFWAGNLKNYCHI